MLDGIDYKKMRELQTKGIRDIARDWAGAKRERKSRTTDMMVEGVGKVQVLNENNYTMQQVRKSVKEMGVEKWLGCCPLSSLLFSSLLSRVFLSNERLF